MDIEALRAYCGTDDLIWTGHCLKRLVSRGIERNEVVQAIRRGEIIEDYPDDFPYPSCLIFGITINGRMLHVVCGVGQGKLYVISAYDPGKDKWGCDFKTRRKG